MISNAHLKWFILLVAKLAKQCPDVLNFIKECDVKELIKKEMNK